MDYKDFKTQDFLKDEFFVQWVKKGNPEACHFWESWLESHPAKKSEIAEAREIIEGIRYKRKGIPGELLYNEVLEGIHREEDYRKKIQYHERSRWYTGSARVAAVLLFLIMTSLVLWLVVGQNPIGLDIKSPKRIVKESPLGAKTTFILEDGTKIILNSGSKITYDENYGVSERRVYLEGEAFFEVVKDTFKPFIVNTGNLQTKVLGTSFNISAYPDEGAINIALVTGKVSVSDRKGTFESKLLPDEMASFSKVNSKFNIVPFEYDDVIGWKDGIIVFNKASFAEVSNVLSKWFNVEFKIADDKKIKGTFTGKFDNKTLQEIMEGLGFATEIEFEINGKEVMIK